MAQICISGFASIFRLFLLGLLIVGVLTFYPNPSLFPMQNRIMIAVATVVVYGMSDFILTYVLGLACNCDQHNP